MIVTYDIGQDVYVKGKVQEAHIDKNGEVSYRIHIGTIDQRVNVLEVKGTDVALPPLAKEGLVRCKDCCRFQEGNCQLFYKDGKDQLHIFSFMGPADYCSKAV